MRQQEHDLDEGKEDRPPQRITMRLIITCTGGGRDFISEEERANELLKLEILRLDWQRIGAIENLDSFTHVRELYLQHNKIEVIGELDTLTNLEFLALGSNCIHRLENLRHLSKLQVLDLSFNEIEDVNTQELPRSLVILNLTGNPCCFKFGFQDKIISALPKLMSLNGDQIHMVQQNGGEECKGGSMREIEARNNADDDATTFHVRVQGRGHSRVVPLCFRRGGNLLKTSTWFCTENGLSADAATTLAEKMESAAHRPRSDTMTPKFSGQMETLDTKREGPDDSDGQDRIHAIMKLQQARARIMEQSTASFDQHKRRILATTRRVINRKTAAARSRSDALDEDIHKVLEDARAAVRLRREKVSQENKGFAVDIRQMVERAFAERRKESVAVAAGQTVLSEENS